MLRELRDQVVMVRKELRDLKGSLHKELKVRKVNKVVKVLKVLKVHKELKVVT